MLTPLNIIQYFKNKKIKGDPIDFLIILSWMQTNSQLRKEQNWVPICLPGITQEGFVYAYVNFLTENIGNSNFYFFRYKSI